MDSWARSGADSVREAYKEHLMGPIIAVKDELFKTFRQVSAPFVVFADCHDHHPRPKPDL